MNAIQTNPEPPEVDIFSDPPPPPHEPTTHPLMIADEAPAPKPSADLRAGMAQVTPWQNRYLELVEWPGDYSTPYVGCAVGALIVGSGLMTPDQAIGHGHWHSGTDSIMGMLQARYGAYRELRQPEFSSDYGWPIGGAHPLLRQIERLFDVYDWTFEQIIAELEAQGL